MIQIYLETFSQGFKAASLFVSKIAESKSRQEFIQRFEINAGSLYAAVTLGLDHKNILEGLHRFCKTEWCDPTAEKWIKKTADSYGKCRLVLENNRYFIESPFQKVVEYYHNLDYLRDSFIGDVFQMGQSGSVLPQALPVQIEEESQDEDEFEFGGYTKEKENVAVDETKTSTDLLSVAGEEPVTFRQKNGEAKEEKKVFFFERNGKAIAKLG